MQIEFVLEGLPPTINNYYRYGKSKVYKNENARYWQEGVIEELIREWDGKPELTSSLELTIEFTAKDRRKWDIDNRIKPLQDCLELGGVIMNDRQIERLHVMRKYGKVEETRIRLTEVEDEGE